MKNATMLTLKRLPHTLLGGAVLAALTSLAIAAKQGNSEDSPPPPPKGTTISLSVDERPIDREGKNFNSFAPVVKRVSPAVVRVFTSTKPKYQPGPEYPGFDNPFFRRFFGEDPEERPGPGPRRRFRAPMQHGLGSGVTGNKDGCILTNNHVVEGADEVKVALQDGREVSAAVVGRDPKTDVAVLKIDARDLPWVPMAESDRIEVGDLVLAVGNPFGIGQTVTMGMVSATGRANVGIDYEDFIQTDAAINPGNSGGALVDVEGRLIGINTAILSRSGGNQGIGFAIPTNLARETMTSLIEHGHVVRGFLGVGIQDVTQD